MANTVTVIDTIQCVSMGGDPNGLITVSKVAIDTAAADVDIVAAVAARHIAVVGLIIPQVVADSILTWKSGSTTLFDHPFKITTEVEQDKEIHRIGSPLFMTVRGQKLVVNATAAITFLIHTMFVRRLDMRNFL